jgi:hypothetical protein
LKVAGAGLDHNTRVEAGGREPGRRGFVEIVPLLRRFRPECKQALIFVQPETVVRWHRAGFKLFWEWLSRHRTQAGRKCVSIELRELIFRMVAENPTWGAPRIHGELRMLSFDISERTVLRWMRKALRRPERASRWATFLSNYREAIAAMDFFTVPDLCRPMLNNGLLIEHQCQCRAVAAASTSSFLI